MTIASEISRLQNDKECMRQAIIDKWVDVAASVSFDDYAACISQISSWPKTWYVDVLVVWWGWWWLGWWWGWGWVLICQNVGILLWSSYDITVWCWWCWLCYTKSWECSKWGNSKFSSITALWWWGWGSCYNVIWGWVDWWSGWWAWPNWQCQTIAWKWAEGMWCDGWVPWNYWGGWWWWAWVQGSWVTCNGCLWWNGWNWKQSDISWQNCYYWWWWGGVSFNNMPRSCWWLGGWWAWWIRWNGNIWCSATSYWWWWWGGATCWWNWYQWIVIVRYKTDWSCWISNWNWWVKYTCWAYTIHCFSAVWTFCFEAVS